MSQGPRSYKRLVFFTNNKNIIFEELHVRQVDDGNGHKLLVMLYMFHLMSNKTCVIVELRFRMHIKHSESTIIKYKIQVTRTKEIFVKKFR